MTKKELLEAIKDMPMDAEIAYFKYDGYGGEWEEPLKDCECYKERKKIVLC